MSARSRIGLVLPMFSGDVEAVLGTAVEAEALGFDGVFASDHLFRVGGPADGPALECFTTLAAVGGVTSRIAIGTMVTRAGLRPAGLLAKQAVGLDHVSGGRAILGVGTGDHLSENEHETFGIPVEPLPIRVERLEETVAALRALFAGERYGGGRIVPALEGPLVPPPIRAGGPPIWVGGTSETLVHVAGRAADGWNGWGLPVRAFGRKASLLQGTARAAGRSVDATWGGIVVAGEDEADAERLAVRRAERGLEPAAFTGSAERLAAHLAALAAAGATWTILLLAGPRDRRRLVAERVLHAEA
jgi:alkanesulfonate monooxygenase SsuD/methylene tetrahydromethanopterin reductase-like flavin-dependent oxidoreductase (luciferase family)